MTEILCPHQERVAAALRLGAATEIDYAHIASCPDCGMTAALLEALLAPERVRGKPLQPAERFWWIAKTGKRIDEELATERRGLCALTIANFVTAFLVIVAADVLAGGAIKILAAEAPFRLLGQPLSWWVAAGLVVAIVHAFLTGMWIATRSR